MSESNDQQKIIYSLIGGLAIALGVIGFLLGRESERSPAPVSAAPVAPAPTAPAPNPVEVPAAAPAPPQPEVQYADPRDPSSARMEVAPSGDVVISNLGQPVPGQPVPAAVTTTGEPPAPVAAGDGSVAEYFRKMESIQSNQISDEPTKFATNLMQASMRGDSSGFDELLRDAERMEKEARKIRPPAKCRDFHKESLALMGESRKMLKQLKSAIMVKDMSKVAALSTDAKALETRAKALQSKRAEIEGR